MIAIAVDNTMPLLDDALEILSPRDVREVVRWLRGKPGVPWEALIWSRVAAANTNGEKL